MHVDLKGVHYHITDVTREFLETKLERISYAREYIADLLVTLTKDNTAWIAEVNVNFYRGPNAHLKETTFNLHESIEKLLDKLDAKVRKEQDKIKHNHG